MLLTIGVMLIVAMLLLGVALGRAADEERPFREYPEILAVYRSESAPRCACGTVLRVDRWSAGRCETCAPRRSGAPHPDSIPRLPQTIFNLEKGAP